ncbi:thioredoxin domain-containing protein [Planctomycetota bacterium]|nr:thioredoxin domain-containing protein [Planctomycetota bacterium]
MNQPSSNSPEPSYSNIQTLMRIPTRTTITLLRIYAILALILTAYLTMNSLSGSAIAGCAPGSGCDTVLNSIYSRFANLPVALPAFLTYFITLLCSFYLSPKNPPAVHRLIWAILIPIAYLILGSVIYFSYIQIFILGTLCKYCIASHILGFLTAITILGRNQSTLAIRSGMHLKDPRPTKFSPKAHFILFIIAALLFSPLPIVQAVYKQTTHELQPSFLYTEGSGADRTITYQVSPVFAVTFKVIDFPHLGNVDAPIVLTELYDYTCPNCREMATDLRMLMKEYPDKYVLVTLPVPLNANCNRLVTNTQEHAKDACDLAHLALAMWLSFPEHFPAYHEDLMAGPTPPSPQQATQLALQYIAPDQLKLALENPLIDNQIKSFVEIYAAVGGSLPTLFTGSSIIQGYPGRDEFLPLLISQTEHLEHLPLPDQNQTPPPPPQTPQNTEQNQPQPETSTTPAAPDTQNLQPTTNQQSKAMSPEEFYNYSSKYSQTPPPAAPITGCDGCPRETIMNQQKNAPAIN